MWDSQAKACQKWSWNMKIYLKETRIALCLIQNIRVLWNQLEGAHRSLQSVHVPYRKRTISEPMHSLSWRTATNNTGLLMWSWQHSAYNNMLFLKSYLTVTIAWTINACNLNKYLPALKARNIKWIELSYYLIGELHNLCCSCTTKDRIRRATLEVQNSEYLQGKQSSMSRIQHISVF